MSAFEFKNPTLEEEAEFWKQEAEENPNGLVVIDEDHKIVIATPGAWKGMGYHWEDEIIGKEIHIFAANKDASRKWVLEWLNAPNAWPLSARFNAIRKDGEPREVLLQLQPYFHKGENFLPRGRYGKVRILFADISHGPTNDGNVNEACGLCGRAETHHREVGGGCRAGSERCTSGQVGSRSDPRANERDCRAA